MRRLQAAAVAEVERPSGMQDWEQLGLHATTAEEAQWVKVHQQPPHAKNDGVKAMVKPLSVQGKDSVYFKWK